MTILGSLEASSNRRGRERYPKMVIRVPERSESARKGSFRTLWVPSNRRDPETSRNELFQTLSDINRRFTTLICKISPNWDVQMTVPEGSKLGKMARPKAGSMFFCQFGIESVVFLTQSADDCPLTSKLTLSTSLFWGFRMGTLENRAPNGTGI